MVVILNLKTFLKNNKDSRRLFGEKEIKIILKQLDGITLTQSEKNRLSRDIRPKFKIIEELNKFSDEFELKKDADTLKIIKQAVGEILQDEMGKKVKAILLFGSHANGIVTFRSDIDICVLFKEDISSEEATKFRIRASRGLPEKVDLQVFAVLPQKIKKDIARNHRILFRDQDFNNQDFTITYLKDDDYFIRMKKIFGATV